MQPRTTGFESKISSVCVCVCIERHRQHQHIWTAIKTQKPGTKQEEPHFAASEPRQLDGLKSMTSLSAPRTKRGKPENAKSAQDILHVNSKQHTFEPTPRVLLATCEPWWLLASARVPPIRLPFPLVFSASSCWQQHAVGRVRRRRLCRCLTGCYSTAHFQTT